MTENSEVTNLRRQMQRILNDHETKIGAMRIVLQIVMEGSISQNENRQAVMDNLETATRDAVKRIPLDADRSSRARDATMQEGKQFFSDLRSALGLPPFPGDQESAH